MQMWIEKRKVEDGDGLVFEMVVPNGTAGYVHFSNRYAAASILPLIDFAARMREAVQRLSDVAAAPNDARPWAEINRLRHLMAEANRLEASLMTPDMVERTSTER